MSQIKSDIILYKIIANIIRKIIDINIFIIYIISINFNKKKTIIILNNKIFISITDTFLYIIKNNSF